GPEDVRRTDERVQVAQAEMRAAQSAVAEVQETLALLSSLMERADDAGPLAAAVERLRHARRHAEQTLLDAQEAADRALDMLSEPAGEPGPKFLTGHERTIIVRRAWTRPR